MICDVARMKTKETVREWISTMFQLCFNSPQLINILKSVYTGIYLKWETYKTDNIRIITSIDKLECRSMTLACGTTIMSLYNAKLLQITYWWNFLEIQNNNYVHLISLLLWVTAGTETKNSSWTEAFINV